MYFKKYRSDCATVCAMENISAGSAALRDKMAQGLKTIPAKIVFAATAPYETDAPAALKRNGFKALAEIWRCGDEGQDAPDAICILWGRLRRRAKLFTPGELPTPNGYTAELDCCAIDFMDLDPDDNWQYPDAPCRLLRVPTPKRKPQGAGKLLAKTSEARYYISHEKQILRRLTK